VRGALLLSDGSGDWYRWSAAWDLAGATVGVGFSLFEVEPVEWGGSELTGTVGAHALLKAWLQVRAALPGVWLHDGECDIYTPDAFRARFLV
jgi:hypothetical protein